MSKIKRLLNNGKGIVVGLGGVLCATVITVAVVLYDSYGEGSADNGTTNGQMSIQSQEETTTHTDDGTTTIKNVEDDTTEGGTAGDGMLDSSVNVDSTSESGQVGTTYESITTIEQPVTTTEKEKTTEAIATTKSTEGQTTKPKETQTTTPKETQTESKQQETTTKASELETKSVLEMSDVELLQVGKSLYKQYKSYAEEVLKYTNEVRAEVGVAPLVLDEELCYVSFARAYEMIYGNALGHTRPNGQPWSSLVISAGIQVTKLGENIAAGYFDAREVVQKWKESENHYKNMVNPDFTRMGAGYCYEDDFIYKNSWAQTLAK